MPGSFKLAAAVAVGALLCHTPASAASRVTGDFLTDVRSTANVLALSDRLAMDHAESSGLRAFADSEAVEQALAAGALLDWERSTATAGAVGAVASLDGVLPMAGVATAPAGTTDLVTGRSVAIDRPVRLNEAATMTSDALLPADEATVYYLAHQSGPAFDPLYRATQGETLRHLRTLYAGYLEHGDDTTLRALALQQMPKIDARLDALNQL